jgi:4-hydroxybenzoate polyprenyltransferase
MSTSVQYRLLSRRFLGAYLVTMRPYLLFVSGITGIVGMSLAPELHWPAAVLIALAAFFSYGFGQALTDCFQIDTDRLSSPYRPLTHGTIGRSQVLGVSVVGLTGCVAVFTWFNPWNLLLGAVAGAGLATYTPFKRKWWGGPWYNAWIVVVLAIMAFLAAGGHTEGAHGALPWTMGAVFFGYANFVLAGYFKDIAADKQTNYRTMPVVLGRAPAAVASSILALLGLICLVFARSLAQAYTRWTLLGLASWGFLIAAAGITVTAQILLHRVSTDEDAHTPIGLVVHGYVLGLAAVASAAQPAWTLPLCVFYAGFVAVLRMRPSRSQI